MTKIIDFKTREISDEAKAIAEKTVVDLLTEASQSEMAKNSNVLFLIMENEDNGEYWIHNLSDMDLLWIAENLRLRALSGSD